MEFCPGPSLDRVIQRGVPMPEALVRPIVGQLARALDYVHTSGVLHRDVKPSNVMLTSDGVVKLMDFGLAHSSEWASDITRTLQRPLVGTPSYMAPEQFRSAPLDERIDNYALACLIYELLTGTTPFSEEELAIWKVPVLAVHIARNIPEDRKRMLALLENLLVELRYL